MNQQLTQKEIERIRDLCFSDPAKACAIAQVIVNICQVVSCNTFAAAKGKSPRGVHYQTTKLTGIVIENRKFISIIQ